MSFKAAGRSSKSDAAALDAVATGQIFTANQALEHGLVDKIGFVEDAIARAVELAKLEPRTGALRAVRGIAVRCLVNCRRERTPGSHAGAVDTRPILDLLTPRAYYLWTWLPAVMTNSK